MFVLVCTSTPFFHTALLYGITVNSFNRALSFRTSPELAVITKKQTNKHRYYLVIYGQLQCGWFICTLLACTGCTYLYLLLYKFVHACTISQRESHTHTHTHTPTDQISRKALIPFTLIPIIVTELITLLHSINLLCLKILCTYYSLYLIQFLYGTDYTNILHLFLP